MLRELNENEMEMVSGGDGTDVAGSVGGTIISSGTRHRQNSSYVAFNSTPAPVPFTPEWAGSPGGVPRPPEQAKKHCFDFDLDGLFDFNGDGDSNDEAGLISGELAIGFGYVGNAPVAAIFALNTLYAQWADDNPQFGIGADKCASGN